MVSYCFGLYFSNYNKLQYFSRISCVPPVNFSRLIYLNTAYLFIIIIYIFLSIPNKNPLLLLGFQIYQV